MGKGGGAEGESDEAFESRLGRWEFDYTQIQNKIDYGLDQYEANIFNQEQIRAAKNKAAQNEWAYEEKMRIFDYQNQVQAYNSSVQAFHKQLDYNALAAEISTNDNTRKYNERLTEIGFKNEDLIMQQGFKGREMTQKVQATRADKAFNYQAVALKGLAKQGKVIASGQTGRSARKNLQAVLAEKGRAQSQLVDQVTRDELGYQFALDRMGVDTNFKQKQLQQSMKSSGSQYDADNQQIALQKYSADMGAESRIAAEPQAKPQKSAPIDTPKPHLVPPPKAPSKDQWEMFKPVQGQSSGGGGMGLLATIAGAAIQGAMATGGSDDRFKYNLNRVGTSPSGIPKYTFKYRLDGRHGPTWTGTSAQDLLAMGRADAVFQKEKDGFYYVDYGKLDVKMEVVTT